MTPEQLNRLPPALRRFHDFYDTFSPAWLDRLGEIYAPDFEFHDPFHDFGGDLTELRDYFAKLFKLASSKFVVEDVAIGQNGAYVRWTWEWQLRPSSELRRVPGVTQVKLGPDDRVRYHRDIFDAASGFFDVVPVLGNVLRFVKKRI